MGDEVLVPNLPRLGMGVGKHALRFLAFPRPCSPNFFMKLRKMHRFLTHVGSHLWVKESFHNLRFFFCKISNNSVVTVNYSIFE